MQSAGIGCLDFQAEIYGHIFNSTFKQHIKGRRQAQEQVQVSRPSYIGLAHMISKIVNWPSACT